MKILGVDIGSYSIKVAELETSGRGFSFNGYQEIPLSLDPQKDKNIEIIEALRAISGRRDSDTKWVIAVQQIRVSSTIVRFPFRERPKIAKSLAFELEDEIPLDIDEAVFDAKIVDYTGAGSEVLAVACPKDAVQEIIDQCKDCGFDPDIVTVEGLALDNLFADWDAAPREMPVPILRDRDEIADTKDESPPLPAKLILHMGHSHTLLLVQRDGVLISARSLMWGGRDIASSIAQAFSLPIHEATKLLHEKSFILINKAGATRDQILLSQAISSSISAFMTELRLVLLEIRSSFHLSLDKLELSGGVSQIQNLGSFMTQELEIPANVAQPLMGFKTRLDINEHVAITAPVAVGLAIEALKRQRNPAINLRRGDFVRENRVLINFWENWRTPLQTALVGFLIFFAFALMRDSLTSHLTDSVDQRLADFGKKLAGVTSPTGTETAVKSFIDKEKKRIKDHESLLEAQKMNSALDILEKISSQMPVVKPPANGAGISVSHLAIDNEDVILEGRAASVKSIPLIEQAIGEIAKEKSLKSFLLPVSHLALLEIQKARQASRSVTALRLNENDSSFCAERKKVALEDIKEQIKEQAAALLTRAQESSAWMQAEEKYQSLSPVAQKATLISTVAVVAGLLLWVPWTFYSSSQDSISDYENKQHLIRELFRTTHEAGSIPPASPPISSSELEAKVRDLLAQKLPPDQIQSISSLPPQTIAGINKEVDQAGLSVTLTKLNLQQIIDLGNAMQLVHQMARILGLDIRATRENDHYFDVTFRVLAFSAKPEPVKLTGAKGKGKTPGGKK